jgi:hypothetical protein
LQQKIPVGRCQRSNECVLECLDGSLGCIHTVVMWLHEL